MKFNKQESAILEFKRESPSKQQITKTIVGFCNMHGGQLIIGIDNNCDIVGVDEGQIPQLMEDIRRSIYASCTPTIIPSLHTLRVEDKLLFIIEVSEGMLKPYFISSLGKKEGTYIRVGTETILATAQMIQELEWQSLGKYPDEMPAYHADKNEIDLNAFETFLKTRKIKFTDYALEEMLYHYHILTKEHTRTYPTIGGLLLFGKNPQEYLKESFIICTHFYGTSGREVIATKDCRGNLFQQYREAMSFLLNQLNRQFTIQGIGPRNERLEIPEEALREIVINAIIHRDYLISGPTKIAIFDDRIEVFSPGNFPGPIQTNHLAMGVTYIRNAVISRVFRENGLVEKLGSGFLTLFQSYRERGLPPPIVQEGVGFVNRIRSNYQ